jgi:hypothetical protein
MAFVTAVVDGHVHIHPCYDVDAFFDNAYRNLRETVGVGAEESRAYFLLMSECAGDDFFGALRHIASTNSSTGGIQLRRWSVGITDEAESIVASADGRRLFIIAGRQVACREGLEVLLLGTTGKFQDRRSIREVLDEAVSQGVPHVIPWGAGKWFFGRGKLLSQLLREHRAPMFFLGDEGGRPAFWPYPRHFTEAGRLGVRDLPGTDPLPFAHDVDKVGRVGFCAKMNLDEKRPARSLFQVLGDGNTAIERFARLEPFTRFVRNQVAMQLRKRHSS